VAAGTNPFIAVFVSALLLGSAGSFLLDQQTAAQEVHAPASSWAPTSEAAARVPQGTDEPTPQHASPTVDEAPDLSHEPPFPLEKGSRPSLAEAKQFANKYSRFVAKGNAGIDQLRAEGYLTGEGTPSSPYVLEDFYVNDELSITSINRSLIVREGYVAGQLRLNYVGESLYVHHVFAEDLRINENIKRTGPNTGGLFHDNEFLFVGQIRHFTGEFTQNQIGPRPAGAVAEYLGDAGVSTVAPEVVFNFDGFHGADIHHNRFLGMVDIKLHGHNHADCFVCDVHDHSDEREFPDGEHDHSSVDPANGFDSRHSVRYVSLLFRDNRIEVPSGLALRYHDRNHAGDDRRANSEPNPRLEDPHVHYQDVTLRANTLVGGGLLIDVFNAADDRHPVQNLGVLRLLDNDILVHYDRDAIGRTATLVKGIEVRLADGLQLLARDNEVGFVKMQRPEPGSALLGVLDREPELRGFHISTAQASNLTFQENRVEVGDIGLFAQSLSATVHWSLWGNEFHTTHPWRGQNVENPPEEKP
jgi:hypothetical protein